MNFNGNQPDGRCPRQNIRIYVCLKRVACWRGKVNLASKIQTPMLEFEHRAATGVRDENLKGRALAAVVMSIEERRRRVLFEPTRRC